MLICGIIIGLGIFYCVGDNKINNLENERLEDLSYGITMTLFKNDRFNNVDDNYLKPVQFQQFSIFDKEYQYAVDKKIEKLLEEEYLFNKYPLMILNPYGTNALGLNVYFSTDEEYEFSYTISVIDENIPEFSRRLKNDAKDNFTKEHKYQIIGLVPGYVNSLSLVGTSRDGKNIENSFRIDMTSVEVDGDIFLDVTDGESMEEITDGLFVSFALGYSNNIYDNHGVIRASLTLNDEQNCQRIICYNSDLYYRIGVNTIVVVDRLGRIKDILTIDGYNIHHDYVLDERNNKIISLATSDVERNMAAGDLIVSYDLETGDVRELIDMKDLLLEIYDVARSSPVGQNVSSGNGIDWIHLNSISLVPSKNDMIISAREISSIIYIEDFYKSPKIKYIIADEAVYNRTNYDDLVLSKVGDFVSQAAQHTVEYIKEDSLGDGQYYLIMYNNNFGETYAYPEFPWDKYPGVGNYLEGECSMYYKYLVDEVAGTYQLVDEITVDYSSIVSNVQDLEKNHIIASGMSSCFFEYDRDGKLIRRFDLGSQIQPYRVFKYDFNGVWFK